MSARSFYNLDQTVWAKMLEKNVDKIRQEMLLALKREKGNWTLPYPDYVEGGQWRTYDLVFWGIRILDNLKECPETQRLLNSIPELVAASFSLLPPHTDIKPHKGYSKMITRCHLPLIVPKGDLGIEVNGEVRVWEEGKLISFDDSLEHRAWNHSKETRIVMMIDVASQEFNYTSDEICRYKIENLKDPYLLKFASKEKWMEIYEKGSV